MYIKNRNLTTSPTIMRLAKLLNSGAMVHVHEYQELLIFLVIAEKTDHIISSLHASTKLLRTQNLQQEASGHYYRNLCTTRALASSPSPMRATFHVKTFLTRFANIRSDDGTYHQRKIAAPAETLQ